MGELYGLLEEETMVCKKLFIDSFGLFSVTFKNNFSVIQGYCRKTQMYIGEQKFLKFK